MVGWVGRACLMHVFILVKLERCCVVLSPAHGRILFYLRLVGLGVQVGSKLVVSRVLCFQVWNLKEPFWPSIWMSV